MIKETAVEIRTHDGVSDAFLYHPDGKGPWRGVLHYTDIAGNREVTRELSKRIAAEGYVVLMPNVFYRTGKPPLFDFPRRLGDERTMRRFGELSGPLSPEAMDRDAASYVDFLSAREGVEPEGMAVVGYCFTGAMALRTAAVRPEKIVAAASFHGGGLFKEDATSPHLVLPKVKARLYFAHAENDNSMPADAIARLEAALKNWGGRYESETYAGAGHGWTMSDFPTYDLQQAERAFQKLAELLHSMPG
jgi:carboxymethylenebutenolidase